MNLFNFFILMMRRCDPLGFGTVNRGDTKVREKLGTRLTTPFLIKVLTSSSTVGEVRLSRRLIRRRRGLVVNEKRAPCATVL